VYNLGVDVGGTFTDVIVSDEDTHDLTIDKVLSTPANPSEGVLAGVEEATQPGRRSPRVRQSWSVHIVNGIQNL